MVAQDRPLIAVKGASGVVIENLELIGGSTAVSIGEGADRTVVRGCHIRSYEDTGIGLSGGASQCIVENCEITRGALEEWAPSMEHSRSNYEIWRIHKDVGKYDRVGINLFRAASATKSSTTAWTGSSTASAWAITKRSPWMTRCQMPLMGGAP